MPLRNRSEEMFSRLSFELVSSVPFDESLSFALVPWSFAAIFKTGRCFKECRKRNATIADSLDDNLSGLYCEQMRQGQTLHCERLSHVSHILFFYLSLLVLTIKLYLSYLRFVIFPS
ncbi:hypothetical protein RN001_015582 [Aquatica leii]|uniref:Uncharacterized protein n=1 Tax=Aquatica leii TaxID=1421715 RepID=A0AAN7SLB2_9COLE|nr:hypothetical protein RN001_015582 [Aquatica leii]